MKKKHERKRDGRNRRGRREERGEEEEKPTTYSSKFLRLVYMPILGCKRGPAAYKGGFGGARRS